MKPTALILITSLLLEMLAPTLLHATQHPQGTQVEGNTRPETAEKEADAAEQAVQMFYEKDVEVMSRGEIDSSKLRKGWHVHVVYTSEGVKETITGQILDKDADGIVIQSRASALWRADRERWEIAYGDIDTLAGARDPGDIKRWGKESKVRFKAPSISRGWIVGRLIEVSPDTFRIFTERGFDYVPHSLISNLEVRIGRRRNTGKGMAIGLALGVAFVVPFAIAEARDPYFKFPGYGTAYATMFGFIPIVIFCTLIGAEIKSDIWVKVPPRRLNLSISPTPTRGLSRRTFIQFLTCQCPVPFTDRLSPSAERLFQEWPLCDGACHNPYGGLLIVLLQTKEGSMKSIATFAAVTILFHTLAPTLAHATKHLQGAEIEGNTRPETAKKEAEVAERVIQWFYEKDVEVMSRGEIDPSKFTRGWYAHVVYTLKGVKETATGEIFDKDGDGMVIQSRASVLWRADRERWEIAYGDIDTLAVTEYRRDIERWKRRYEGKGLRVMSGGELDLSKLRKGWYAHVVYTSEGAKRTITGEIVNKDGDGIVIKSKYGGWNNTWKRFEIAYGDIEIVVVAQDPEDITPRDIKRWGEARQAIQRLQEKVSKVRFKAPSISRGWIVGRLVKVSPDTFRILTQRGFDYVPHSLISNLEVRIGRRRNTDKGIIIGLGLGLTVLAPFVIRDNSDELQGLVFYYFTMFIALPVFISCTLIGAAIKSDIWAEVPPQRLNLSISPTPTRGLRAALSFKF